LYSGEVETDDFGNRYTGQFRLGGTFNLNSPLRLGDQLTLTGLTTGRDLRYGRAAYQLPIGGDGLRLGAAYFGTSYRLGKDFSQLLAHGTGSGATLYAAYPFVVTQRSNVTGTLSLDQKHLTDYVDLTAAVTEKHVYVATLGFSASHWDAFGGRGLTSGNLSVAMGDLQIDSDVAFIIDRFTAGTNGRYLRASYGVSRLQQLTSRTSLWVSFSGQLANKNLDSSEKYSLGGQDGVRAYPQGEAIGDAGYLANVELRRSLWQSVQGVLFYDVGDVMVNHTPFEVQQANSRKLAGAGLGLNAQIGGFQIRTAAAWSTDGGAPKSIPPSAAHPWNAWLQLRQTF
jgi:hemolysin activation/secretion protein